MSAPGWVAQHRADAREYSASGGISGVWADDYARLLNLIEQMGEALRAVLTEFGPGHLDYVSKSECGKLADAALAAYEKGPTP